jgi:hypothetical protein
VSDDRTAPDRLDASGPGKRRHVSAHAAGCEIDGDESRLEISCYECDLASSLDLGEAARSESEGRSPGDECTTIHAKEVRMQPLMRSVKFVPVGIVHHNTADEVDRLLTELETV